MAIDNNQKSSNYENIYEITNNMAISKLKAKFDLSKSLNATHKKNFAPNLNSSTKLEK